jgi:hypothetical protein
LTPAFDDNAAGTTATLDGDDAGGTVMLDEDHAAGSTVTLDGDGPGGSTATLDAHDRRRRKPTRKADWLVLAYLAGDNDLESALLDDLREMERVGSRPRSVEILAQVDRARTHDVSDGDWVGTRRYHVTRADDVTHPGDTGRLGSTLLADLGETNTGDPRTLERFVALGARRFPARASMLVLSNHGSGVYVPSSMQSDERPAPVRRWRTRGQRSVRRTLFHTSWACLLAPSGHRGIAYDDGAADCLDNRELKRVLAHAHRVLGRPVDVVGMDACLMTMLEVAYQLRDHARVLVGSEEVEPGPGWPWADVLGDLTSRPTMTPAELATIVVRRYAEWYGTDGPEITQSAIDLAKLDDVVRAVDALARALLGALPSVSLERGLYVAWRGALRFFDGLYVDLHHFAGNLARATGQRDIRRACMEIQGAIEADGGPIIAERHAGARMAPACGLSIYFPPFRDPSVFYRELDFTRTTRWADFLDAYLGGSNR